MTNLLDEAKTPEEITQWWERFGLNHAKAREARQAAYARQREETMKVYNENLPSRPYPARQE